ncbi:hypothetical protein BKA65DRAFT_473150 [Rhexocercosporidium sp. MPI-PUGE-AT-0058]|nr:hypothetical protein BKA65DRAFT_473150 [Rhexocercosporidium sp. MPI-PUGE-AT-0058]
MIANSGSPDHLTEEKRAEDARDVEALAGVVTDLELRMGQLCNPSTQAELLAHMNELESELRVEKAKVEGKEEAMADSVQIREDLERELANVKEERDATEKEMADRIAFLEATLQEGQAISTQHAFKPSSSAETTTPCESHQPSNMDSADTLAEIDHLRRKVVGLTTSRDDEAARANQLQTNLDRAARKLADLDRNYDILEVQFNEKVRNSRTFETKEAHWREEKRDLDGQLQTSHEDRLKLERANSQLQIQLASLQEKKEALERDINCWTVNGAAQHANQEESEIDRLRMANSNIRNEGQRLNTQIQDLEDKSRIAEQLGPVTSVEEDLEHQKRRKILWKNHAKGLKKSLEKSEGELEKVRSAYYELAEALKRIRDLSKQEVATLARRFPSLGDENEDEDEGSGVEDASAVPPLVGHKQPVYNMIIGHGTLGGSSSRRVSQHLFSIAQDNIPPPDISLKPKSTDPVPGGYAVVKEVVIPVVAKY